uniref:Uncharacterized protein n=1 Tax=Erythrolobus australicus TaxID=1077150 RepID=A0A7S1TNJ5_9RHOD|mmetsp:Transcript_3631/g.10104  ORF Transcript_3631/g.10104 Transcript_3631/m.10104 type:complete len:293 (+) Transcript_3631:29-907(+)
MPSHLSRRYAVALVIIMMVAQVGTATVPSMFKSTQSASVKASAECAIFDYGCRDCQACGGLADFARACKSLRDTARPSLSCWSASFWSSIYRNACLPFSMVMSNEDDINAVVIHCKAQKESLDQQVGLSQVGAYSSSGGSSGFELVSCILSPLSLLLYPLYYIQTWRSEVTEREVLAGDQEALDCISKKDFVFAFRFLALRLLASGVHEVFVSSWVNEVSARSIEDGENLCLTESAAGALGKIVRGAIDSAGIPASACEDLFRNARNDGNARSSGAMSLMFEKIPEACTQFE